MAPIGLEALLLAPACARGSSGWPGAPHPNDPPFAERSELPYSPPAGPRGRGGDGIALSIEGGQTQARGAALALVQALIDANAAVLRGLFAERVVYVMEGVTRPSAEVIARCMQDARSLVYEPSLSADVVVDTAAIEVRLADAYHAQLAMPPGIAPNDLVVSLPLRPAGPDGPRRIACLSSVYVRPGPTPRIVGLAR